MRKLQFAIICVAVGLVGTGSALAHNKPPPRPAPLPLEVVVTPTLASVTRSQEGLTTFAQYKVSIRNPNTWGLGLIQGKFNASTSVLPAGTGTAPFFSTDNTACSNPTATSIACTVPDLLPGASITPFTVTVTAPGFTPPSNGGQINFTHQSTARFNKDNDFDADDPIVSTPAATVSVALTDPNPNTVATVLPLSTGGTVFTGTEGGAATCDNPWTVSVMVPQAATVSLNTAPAPETPPVAATCSAGDCQFFAAVSIPQATFAPTNPLVTTLRRDRCTIEGRGIIGKALQIFEEKIFYRGDEQSAYAKVYPCRITGGPTPGVPCIASRGIYTIFNLPNVPDKLEYLGDHFWIMNSTENGRWGAP